MKVSLIQTSPQADRAGNLDKTRRLMERAYETDRPDLIVLAEYFELLGVSTADKMALAQPHGGDAYQMAQSFARNHKVAVHAGTIMEKLDGDGEGRIHNTSFVFDRDGREIAAYRKIHMFDITGPDGTPYKESATIKPGEDIVTYDLDGLKIGCAICYDIRFAELFMALEKEGCDVIVLPAAFTLQTGKDHWEVLLRARAIETQTYVCAAATTGQTNEGGVVRATYGHSMVVDPWGHVIARASDGEGWVTARLDPAQIRRVRGLIPVRQHRRLAC